MATSDVGATTSLFYSYSHKDVQYLDRMETALAQLRRQGLTTWSDQSIRAGDQISEAIKQQMDIADIFVFLLSPDFIESNPCNAEWHYAEQIAQSNRSIRRIPIIVRPCSWEDFNRTLQLEALPRDGLPVVTFEYEDEAWKQVYEAIKQVIEDLKSTFLPKPECTKEMQDTEFISQDNIQLQDIFVFPRLTTYSTKMNTEEVESTLKDEEELLKSEHTLVYGEKLSGKTALCRHLFLDLVRRGRPVLYIDLESIRKGRSTQNILKSAYNEQFSGEFSAWSRQSDKLIILDNLTNDQKVFAHVQRISSEYDKVLLTVSTDIFYAFFRDNSDLSSFRQVGIRPLTHSMQESLIRKRMTSSIAGKSNPDKQEIDITDGVVDSIENQVNSIIISSKILPRFPFYVLSIIQTYEGYMPSDLAITSYGHCYYVLIVSHLHKVGLSRSDDQLDSCFNFGAHMAFEIFKRDPFRLCLGRSQFDEFVEQYELDYVLPETTLNKMCDVSYGIVLREKGGFKYSYMYYYFLGKYLASHLKEHGDLMERIIANSHTSRNCLALIFTIHHTDDTNLIDDILLRTMCALDSLSPSKLDATESKIFDETVSDMPAEILSPDPVSVHREKERDTRDVHETRLNDDMDSYDDSHGTINDVYRILKNNEILGQILRNKYGSLRRQKISEIVETVADGGLRLVRLLIGDKERIHDFAMFLHNQFPESDLNKIKKLVDRLLLLWTLINVNSIVGALNKPELREWVDEVLASKDAPAYDLISYFLRLDTNDRFSKGDRKALRELWDKHRFPFFHRAVSLRTQHYFNTHMVDRDLEQSVCSLLNIKYKPRLREPGSRT